MVPINNSPSAHWLVAAWPGMGNVSVLSAGYLIQNLGLKPIGEIPHKGRFDISAVGIRDGVVATPRLPRNLLYGTPEGWTGPRVTVFVGEAQPNFGAYAFAKELLTKAREIGATRIVTFASVATQLAPGQDPQVFGAGTSTDMLDALRQIEVQPLPEGQIGGLNGVLLGAATEMGMPGIGLMGQIPFYAAGVVNPRAGRAVLDAFGMLTGIDLTLTDLDPHIAAIDQVLTRMLEQLQAQQSGDLNGADEQSTDEFNQAPDAGIPPALPERSQSAIPEAVRATIEQMFETAKRDRAAAAELKANLDKLGVFPLYEDRFLDLFKRAE